MYLVSPKHALEGVKKMGTIIFFYCLCTVLLERYLYVIYEVTNPY
jgi:hypothetical protein